MKCLNCGKDHDWARTSVGKYCDNKCQQEYQHRKKIDGWLNDGITPGVKVIRRYFQETYGHCQECGISDWNGKPLTLEVDHIDGNHQNNSVTNLRLLCPNCHSQTPTFKAKNKGNGRTQRRKQAPVAQRQCISLVMRRLLVQIQSWALIGIVYHTSRDHHIRLTTGCSAGGSARLLGS